MKTNIICKPLSCGIKRRTFTSYYPEVLITFTSDGSVQKQGFKIMYQEGNNGSTHT